MQQPIEFAKLSGSGNDFICIDNRDNRYSELLSDSESIGHFARALCRRGLGVGADGVIFACGHEVGEYADVAARFLEADGSEAELCGNGTACFTRWILDNDWFPGVREIRILTGAGVVRGSDSDEAYVKVCIPFPEHKIQGQTLEVDGESLRYDFAITGVPHAVIYVPQVGAVDVQRLGRKIRHHEAFRPRGVNANFVEHLEPGLIAIRTFEFGVEAETFACGTGSATAALFAARQFRWPRAYLSGEKPVRVRARSGDVLKVWVTLDASEEVCDLCLETVVREIFRGRLEPAMAQVALQRIPTETA
jgi:diaminopimelate epimerase